jgi:hypothetical protein
MDTNRADQLAQDIENYGKDAVIRRELFARECFWDGDIERCVDELEGYGITRSEIQSMYQIIRESEIDN